MLRCWADGADGRQTYSSLHRCCCYFCSCASPPAAGLAAICPLARLQPSQQPHQPPHLPSAPPRCSSTSRWPPRPSPFGSSRWCQRWASSTSAPCLHTLAGALDGWQRCIAVLQEPGIAASALACPHGTRPERSAVTFVGPNLHHRLTTRTHPPATRSMADNIHAIVKGEGGPPPVFEWVMLGVSALMCVVGAIFVSYSIK